jgi:hypothetical protein
LCLGLRACYIAIILAGHHILGMYFNPSFITNYSLYLSFLSSPLLSSPLLSSPLLSSPLLSSPIPSLPLPSTPLFFFLSSFLSLSLFLSFLLLEFALVCYVELKDLNLEVP